MPTTDHPILIIVAGVACLAAAFPLARFFFDDIDTFMGDLLGFLLLTPMQKFKVIGFVGSLAMVFLAVYSLAFRMSAAQ